MVGRTSRTESGSVDSFFFFGASRSIHGRVHEMAKFKNK